MLVEWTRGTCSRPSRRAASGEGAATARPELRRESRQGVPEVRLAEPKTVVARVAGVGPGLDGRGRALVSSVRPAQSDALVRN